MRATNPLEKLAASAYNAAIALVISLPIGLASDFSAGWRFAAIAIFFLVQVLETHRERGFRCHGMRIVGTRWARRYAADQQALYTILYTLSFATLFIHVVFPFDIFLANMLFLQLPSIYLTGTTVHGYLAGGMRTVRS